MLVRLAIGFDGRELDRELDEAFGGREFEDLVDTWLMPALRRLGEAWRAGTVSIAGEHLVSAAVQRRLATALDALSSVQGAPRIIVGLARGSRHELGAMAFGVLLARAGFDVLYVGGDLPPESWVVAVAGHARSAGVGVPSVEDVPAVRDTVSAIHAARPEVPLLLGGSHQELVRAGEPLGHD
ncbi:MAG: cobalamin B12-binding domain-containing protein, partial [Nocardioides sp.]